MLVHVAASHEGASKVCDEALAGTFEAAKVPQQDAPEHVAAKGPADAVVAAAESGPGIAAAAAFDCVRAN